jgi:hypothetical protein
MNLGDILKAPLLPVALACAVFLYLAPRASWLPSEMNAPIANIGVVCALIAIVLPIVDMIAARKK